MVDKATFDLTDKEVKEQNVLYVDVVNSVGTTKQGRAIFKVSGDIFIYAPNDKLTFGYFNKCLEKADPSDSLDLFFHKIDYSGEYMGNLVERRCSFVYFYSAQYDPEAGEINEIETAII